MHLADCSKVYPSWGTPSDFYILHKNNIILSKEGGEPINESKIINEIKLYIDKIKNEIIDAIKN